MTKKYNSPDNHSHSETVNYWRSVEDSKGTPSFSAALDHEKASQSAEADRLGVSRRSFLTLMGASATLAGLTASGCIRKPVENILPYAKRPEEIVPGNPVFFATAMSIGPQVLGLLVESQEGRPTKIEGNEKHPMSLGATSVWAQSSVMELYDPDRSKAPAKNGKKASWDGFFQSLNAALNPLKKKGGQGLALLVEERPSPSFQAMLSKLKASFPKAQIFRHDHAASANQEAARKAVGLGGVMPNVDLGVANIVLSLDHDFLGTEGDAVRHANQFASRRGREAIEKKTMNRLYVAEGRHTLTGANADHRFRMASYQIGDFLNELAQRLLAKTGNAVSIEASLSKQLQERSKQFHKTQSAAQKKAWGTWLSVLEEDLLSNRGRSLVVVGERQPARVHALAALVNEALGNVGKGKPVEYIPHDSKGQVEPGSVQDLVSAVEAGSVELLVMLGGNPAFSAPADADFGRLLQRVPTSIHHSIFLDETSQASTWHAPGSHFLEAWGDLRATDGTVSIQQPLIAPLYGTISELELLAYIVGGQQLDGHKIVQDHWKQTQKTGFARAWRRWLHDGLMDGSTGSHKAQKAQWSGLEALWAEAPTTLEEDAFELNFVLDASLQDGRFANNAWLQELPDPVTKLTWDNAAYISPKLARERKLKDGHQVIIRHNKRKLQIPVFVSPGLADRSIVLPLGYGRNFGRVASMNPGFNTYQLLASDAPHFATGATLQVKKGEKRYAFASTQEHGRLEEPALIRKEGFNRTGIVRQASVEDFSKKPEMIQAMDLMPPDKLKSLWHEPNNSTGHQWGMSIDLSRCTGCGVCTVACQSENNIPVVGKREVLNGREMHWIRLDRYYTGSEEDPQVVMQPMACGHCETAPCENVCPVAATTHSPEGLNDMAYNRCIGTRYCSNNCPYKVRRFNFFNFTKRNDELSANFQLQRNPDVTVRFRGVMEKCTYCTQRISEAKIEAKVKGDGTVRDGRIQTACQQACPSRAIIFGDIADPKSAVSKSKDDKRNYGVLSFLNTRPRTTYLAKIRNPHPKLAPKEKKAHGHHAAPKKDKKAHGHQATPKKAKKKAQKHH